MAIGDQYTEMDSLHGVLVHVYHAITLFVFFVLLCDNKKSNSFPDIVRSQTIIVLFEISHGIPSQDMQDNIPRHSQCITFEMESLVQEAASSGALVLSACQVEQFQQLIDSSAPESSWIRSSP
mmetsp:Transcript_23578/g.54848  ORF Transcript_23578/g.54848 Transcript_23578/m.54848 type:complete len:123 (-) Transcript_23578:554-922(-)